MHEHHRRGLALAFLLGAAPALGMGCGGDPAPSRGERLPGTPGLVQDFIENVLDDEEAYTDAADRLLMAAATGSAEGVTLFGDDGFRTGTLEVDLDGDGTLETPFDVSIQRDPRDPTGPVRFGVSQGGPGEDLVSLNAEASLDEGGNIVLDNVFGSLEADTLSIFADEGGGTIPLAPEEGTVLGSIGYSAFDPDYEDIIGGTFTVEFVGGGSFYRILVTVDDDPETPEDESLSFYVD